MRCNGMLLETAAGLLAYASYDTIIPKWGVMGQTFVSPKMVRTASLFALADGIKNLFSSGRVKYSRYRESLGDDTVKGRITKGLYGITIVGGVMVLTYHGPAIITATVGEFTGCLGAASIFLLYRGGDSPCSKVKCNTLR